MRTQMLMIGFRKGETTMRKYAKKIISAMLVIMMTLQVIQPYMFTVEAADDVAETVARPSWTDDTTGIVYELYESIKPYKQKDKVSDPDYPDKEGYVFAGWWTEDSVSESNGISTLKSIGTATKEGAAWAKFVPEEVLTVKAQVSKRVKDTIVNNNGSLTTNASIKLRLAVGVDDAYQYYRDDAKQEGGIGFKVTINEKERDIRAKWRTFGHVTYTEGKGAKLIAPQEVFGTEAASRFAIAVISGFSTVDRIQDMELSVTPYWITLDGTTAYGPTRSRLLASDDRCSDDDGTDANSSVEGEDFELSADKKTYTFEETAKSATAAYKFLKGGSDTVYLKGYYTNTNGAKNANNYFGITIRNGGQTRQIYFDGVGVRVLDNENVASYTDYSTVTKIDDMKATMSAGAYVWSQRANTLGDNSDDVSIVKDMLSTPGKYEVIWAIEKNVLYCSVGLRKNDDTTDVSYAVFRIPMENLFAKWRLGRYYQFGVSSYNTGDLTAGSTNNSALPFTVETLAVGKAAKALLKTEKSTMHYNAFMCYEPISGSYVTPSISAQSYRYGIATRGPQAMTTTIRLVDPSSTTSQIGVSVKRGDDMSHSAQIVLKGNGETAELQFNHQKHNPINITDINTPVVPENESDEKYINGECKVTAIIKNERLYIKYNGHQAGNIALNKIVEGYEKGDEVQLGIYAWDANNGLARFSDVQFTFGDAVEYATDEENPEFATTSANWKNLYIPQNRTPDAGVVINNVVTNADVSDAATGVIKETTSAEDSAVCFENEDAKWEVSGKLKREDGNDNPQLAIHVAQVDAQKGYKDIANDKFLQVKTSGKGISLTSKLMENYTAYQDGDNALSFNQEIGKFFDTHEIDEIYFKFLIVNDRLYALFSEDGSEWVPSWNIPLNQKIEGYTYDANNNIGTYDGNTTVFDGFTKDANAEEIEYYIRLMTIQGTDVNSTISDLVVNMGDEVDTTLLKEFPDFHTESIVNGPEVNASEGTIASVANATNVQEVQFQDYSTTWEVSGTMTKTAGQAWCPGFTIRTADGKDLILTAVTKGVVFYDSDLSRRYGWHGLGETLYNFNVDIADFVTGTGTKTTMNFKAVIANDTFYVWFGDSADDMKLSWEIPLGSAVKKTDNTTEIFGGFGKGSKYNLSVHVKEGSGAGSFSNMSVKTDAAVDISWMDARVNQFDTDGEPSNASINKNAGVISSNTKLLETKFAGTSSTWDVSGKMTRNDPAKTDANNTCGADWCPGFTIRVGEQVLDITAVTSGMVFNDLSRGTSGYTRYAYHAFKETTYNKNTTISKFVNSTKVNGQPSSRAESEMYFRAVIYDNTFYVWYWYEGETMGEPSWVIPLDEALYGVAGDTGGLDSTLDDGTETFFSGFTGSDYSLGIHVKATTGLGTISNLSVKNGDYALGYALSSSVGLVTEDPTTGLAPIFGGKIIPKSGLENVGNAAVFTEFNGTSDKWEVSGTMRRTAGDTVDGWCPGFNIKVGNEVLTLSAVTRGLVFNQDYLVPSEYEYTQGARYGNHALKQTVYNRNLDIESFVNANNTETAMNFKAVIYQDTLYVWYGFEDEEMTLSWIVPLDEKIYGASNEDSWDGSVNQAVSGGDGILDDKQVIFNGFTTTDSTLSYGFGLNLMTSLSTGYFDNVVVKSGEDVAKPEIPKFMLIGSKNVEVTEDAITTVSAESESHAYFMDSNQKWEVTGTMIREDKYSAEAWCPGFTITVGTQRLSLSAVTSGIVFNQFNLEKRYPEHAFLVTEYNRNTAINEFVRVPKSDEGILRSEDIMDFRAVITDDVLYVWFGYPGEDMKLSWIVPLAEKLYGVTGVDGDKDAEGDDGSKVIFEGFAAGSRYNLALNAMKSTGVGSFTNLEVKTGNDISTEGIPKILVDEVQNMDVDADNGTITSTTANGLESVNFLGYNQVWEVSGTMNRTGNAAWCPGFTITTTVGEETQELTCSAITSGIVFNQYTDRYPYHAINVGTKYNLDGSINTFVSSLAKSTVNFRAVIANDTFYVWFDYNDGRGEILSWKVPLAEALYGDGPQDFDGDGIADKDDVIFDGFAAGSRYNLGLHVFEGAPFSNRSGNFSNLTVKTGSEVDLSFLNNLN